MTKSNAPLLNIKSLEPALLKFKEMVPFGRTDITHQ